MSVMSEFVDLLPVGGCRFSLLRSLIDDPGAIEDFGHVRRRGTATLHRGGWELLDAADQGGVTKPTGVHR
jgi:hypothetical protein